MLPPNPYGGGGAFASPSHRDPPAIKVSVPIRPDHGEGESTGPVEAGTDGGDGAPDGGGRGGRGGGRGIGGADGVVARQPHRDPGVRPPARHLLQAQRREAPRSLRHPP